MKEIKRIFWVESGLMKLSVKERLSVAYVVLSFFGVLAACEASFLLFLLTAANLAVAVKMASEIHVPDEE
jgi:hypothetical protein